MIGNISSDIFEYFSEPKSRSNVWSRQRLDIKQKLEAFAKSFYESFDIEEYGLEVTASDHYPSLWNRKCVDRQWIFFSKGKEARKVVEEIIDTDKTLRATITDPTPYFKNVFLALDLSSEAISLAVYLHWKAWVDRDNFLARMNAAGEREQWLEFVRSLPDEYVVKADGADPVAAVDMNEQNLSTCIDAFRSNEKFLSTGLFVPRDKSLELGEDLWDVLKVAFMLLIPVYELMAWSPENDFISMSDKRRELEEKRKSVADQFEKEREAFKAQKQKDKLEQIRRHKELVEKRKDLREQLERQPPPRPRPEPERQPPLQPRPEPEPEPEKDKDKERKQRPPRPDYPPGPKERRPLQPGRTARLKPAVDDRKAEALPQMPEAGPGTGDAGETAQFKYGDRVRIMDGAFKGKWGIVQEIDGRGKVKVILGSMVARLSTAEVAPVKFSRR